MKIIKENNNRYYFIDCLKIIAIYCVIFYHCFRVPLDFNLKTNGDIITYGIYTIMSIGVPLFFTINGFLLFEKEINIKKHVKKVLNIIMITGIWAIITLTCTMILYGDNFAIKSFIKDLLTLKVGYINHLWFMEALVFIYVFFPFLKWLYNRSFLGFCTVFAISVLLFFGIPAIQNLNAVSEYFGNPSWKIVNLLGKFKMIYFSYSISYFMLGGILKYFFKMQKKGSKLFLYIAGIISLILLILHIMYGIVSCKIQKTVFDSVWAGYNSILILGVIIGLFFIMSQININTLPNFLKSISQNTLGIYFIHPILIAASMWKIEPYLVNNIIVTLYSTFILLISIFIVLIIKKIPYVRYIFKI